MKRFLFAVCAIVLIADPSWAGPEDALFETAKIIYESADDQSPKLQSLSYVSVRTILDQIVAEYPGSDLAVRIILKDTIEGMDVGALDKLIEAAEAEDITEPATTETPPVDALVAAIDPSDVQTTELATLPFEGAPQSPSREFTVSNEATEEALGLDRNGIRDLQARLLVGGHDPNGVDGAVGRGTRAAISAWQASIGAVETGYMSEDLLVALKAETEAALKVWLQTPTNSSAYLPPPVIALGPRNMSGTWNYVSRCGPNSRTPNTRDAGSMTLRHARGNQYSGTMVTSQGLRGNLGAILNGRNVRGTANFGFLIGKVNVSARVDDQRLVLRGRDSHGCSFYASKR